MFHRLYDKAVAAYQSGNRAPASFFTSEENRFLQSIGCTAQELYDFAEDWCQDREPSFDAVLLITAVRREYFFLEQNQKWSGKTIRMDELPAKTAEADGIAWLPRLIEKARVKLRGEMPSELMYGCSGDRRFLHRVNVAPADFLRHVWLAGDDTQQVVNWVKKNRAE